VPGNHQAGEGLLSGKSEAAAARALACDGISYKSMNSILKNGLDQVPLSDEAPPEALPPIETSAPRLL